MAFRILGLDPAPFRPLYGLSDAALAERGVQRMVANAPRSFPDRIELRDLEIGETALLLSHEHQPAANAFRSRHAIFVREGAEAAIELTGVVPEVMHRRMLSLRAFDEADFMVDADLAEGDAIAPLIDRLLADGRVAYLHAHYARRGCYAARVERA
ncbi:DUF1203 domain-containing protein [Sphingoaurantiacus capsulatus]|uniref:DUF1203 domain-containing protein n=1 Tax=Sphingoaurantiacus capsulatus TaxID=1771310 RepID=A0ABV7X4Z7_9SPHN